MAHKFVWDNVEFALSGAWIGAILGPSYVLYHFGIQYFYSLFYPYPLELFHITWVEYLLFLCLLIVFSFGMGLVFGFYLGSLASVVVRRVSRVVMMVFPHAHLDNTYVKQLTGVYGLFIGFCLAEFGPFRGFSEPGLNAARISVLSLWTGFLYYRFLIFADPIRNP